MTRRGLVAAACLAMLCAVSGNGQEEEPAARPHRTRPVVAARPAPPAAMSNEDRALLYQLADAQRALGDQVQQLKDRIDALASGLAAGKDERAGVEQDVKALRDEVKGLYVESSSVKQQIDAVREDVHAVNSNVSGFRTFSGFFIAAMLLLLTVIFILTIRR
jgi:hypothetical protein